MYRILWEHEDYVVGKYLSVYKKIYYKKKGLCAKDVDVAQLEECLPSMYKALELIDSTTQIALMGHAYNLSTWEVEVERLEGQDHPKLHSKFEASLEYMGPVSRSIQCNSIQSNAMQ